MKIIYVVVACLIISGCASDADFADTWYYKTPIKKTEIKSQWISTVLSDGEYVTIDDKFFILRYRNDSVTLTTQPSVCVRSFEHANKELNSRRTIARYPYVDDSLVIEYNEILNRNVSAFNNCMAIINKEYVAQTTVIDQRIKKAQARQDALNANARAVEAARIARANKARAAALAKENSIKTFDVRAIRWYRGGFNTVLLADLRIVNGSNVNRSNITVTCYGYSENLTLIDKNESVIYRDFPAGAKRTITEFNMGFLHGQVERINCISKD